MSDIVERLRTGCGCDDYPDAPCMAVNECKDAFEAAAEIERLREALEDINQIANSLSAPNLVLNSISRAARAALERKDE